MNMSINKKTIFRLALLLFIAVSAIQLTACGPDVAPGNSIIKVEAFGDPIINGPTTNPSVTSTTTKTQTYRITLADETGLPMNDLDVNLLGQFTNGQSINFGGAIGSAPVTLSTTKKTGDFGFLDFAIKIPYYAIGVQLLPPYNQTVLAGAGLGSLTDDTYHYTVTSVDLAGESTALPFMQIILSGVTNTITGAGTGSVDLSWKKVVGASRYYVYAYNETTYTSIGALAFVDCDPVLGCTDPVTWTDDGSYWPPNTLLTPPTTNTTGLGINGVKGTMQVTSGAAKATTQTIDF
jgi:hypothetical protein